MKKNIKQLLKHFKVSEVALTKGNHIRIKINGTVIVTGSTPSDGRSLKNLKASLKRATKS